MSERAGVPDTESERFLPWMEDPRIGYEHLHRYAFASLFVSGRTVLDLACGEGYGSFMLAQNASEVIGIDVDRGATEHASSKYLKDNLRFVEGSMTEVPVDGEKVFDVVVCLEAIEHIEDHEKLLLEVKRLIKDDGVFVISTPDKRVRSDVSGRVNPFHLKELSLDDLRELLDRNFKHTLLYGQKVYPSSNIFPLAARPGDNVDFAVEKAGGEFVLVTPQRKEWRNLIAISSDSPIDAAPCGSYLVDVSETLFRLKDAKIAHLRIYKASYEYIMNKPAVRAYRAVKRFLRRLLGSRGRGRPEGEA